MVSLPRWSRGRDRGQCNRRRPGRKRGAGVAVWELCNKVRNAAAEPGAHFPGPLQLRLGSEDMPRRVYLLGVGLALVALALAITDAVMGPSPGVTEANVRRIRVGMGMKEVAARLGGP